MKMSLKKRMFVPHFLKSSVYKVRVPRCLKVFENYCKVTQGVRKGIELNVNVV